MNKELLDAYNTFCYREYEDEPIQELPKDGILHIAYTTYKFDDDCEHEIQVDFDVKNLEYLNYIDKELVLKERYNLNQVIEDLKYMSFEDSISNCVWVGFEKYGHEGE